MPDDATNISFGIIMGGTGTAWFDDLAVELDGEAWHSDGFDFGFESGRLPRGFHSNDDTYVTGIDDEVGRTGSRSLRIKGVPAPEAPPGRTDNVEAAAATVALLDENREAWVAASSATAFEWARHNAVIVHQCMRSRGGGSFMIRDEAMADNVTWILEQNPDAKIVLWAHNSHVSRGHQWMGDHLGRRFGEGYIPVGFATRFGTYTAWSNEDLARNPLAEPSPWSVEAFLAGAGYPLAYLDLRTSVPGDPASGWLHEDREIRGIGAMAMEQQFSPVRAARHWDILIYIEETSPTSVLGRQ